MSSLLMTGNNFEITIAEKTRGKRRHKQNWLQDQLFLFAQTVHKRLNIIKWKFGPGMASQLKREAQEQTCL